MLATLINESALNALKHQRIEITESDILEVKDKIAYGKKKPQTLDENQKN